MLAVHARYRGREVRRAELVRRSAEALSTLQGVGEFRMLGVEDICAAIDSPEALCDIVMALLSDGGWAIGIGIVPGAPQSGQTEEVEERVRGIATASLPGRTRAGGVWVRIDAADTSRASASRASADSNDIAATFALVGHVLSKRTVEGREATSLMRSGLNQNEAAAELGISKQAMSQRLQAAGWQVESGGWQLAVNLIRRAGTTP
ncbi:hypothetical protein [Corynebacterium halotolerans]|uniref:DNA-binding protein n=1 Tax=Corynebacterium halotolerans YIM 70093 = DSM 44683 TaxID=1121362 RepID=M1NST1_9CORY|nr:hypothetical protein [Corynebacterium halotolerans]AGF72497.1 hypothetical protein A605_07475 [Corynebacterium halotolerans YIM 70093 = DSM 44683]